jgi:NAD(P)-dependent dehydrogenase (short-subunit alcohol dehydrogenase family)
MEQIFEGKTAIVTGANSGIGQATAYAFAERGANVVIADVTSDMTTMKTIHARGGSAIFVHCDVSKEEDVMSLIHKTLAAFDGLDYAYNNAGIEGVSAHIQDISVEEWDRTIDINLKGVWLCMKHEIREMLKHGQGAIVNCASVAGLVGFEGIAPYEASKHGVVGLTKTAALENAKTGIRINAICPGVIHTPMIDRFLKGNAANEAALSAGEPVGRMGSPEEIAEAVMWLCSDASSFVTGDAIPVDGGWVAQ